MKYFNRSFLETFPANICTISSGNFPSKFLYHLPLFWKFWNNYIWLKLLLKVESGVFNLDVITQGFPFSLYFHHALTRICSYLHWYVKMSWNTVEHHWQVNISVVNLTSSYFHLKWNCSQQDYAWLLFPFHLGHCHDWVQSAQSSQSACLVLWSQKHNKQKACTFAMNLSKIWQQLKCTTVFLKRIMV